MVPFLGDTGVRRTTLEVAAERLLQATAAALAQCPVRQLQEWPDDSIGLRYTSRPLVAYGRRRWPPPAAANAITVTSVSWA
jgi:hypothetical protein